MKRPKPGQQDSFDFERLVVYQKALELLTILGPGLQNPPRKASSIMDQLDRACCSTLLNIAEGSGKEPGSRDRLRFYRIALGSAKETGACLAILEIRGFLSRAVSTAARTLALSVVRMLSSMTR